MDRKLAEAFVVELTELSNKYGIAVESMEDVFLFPIVDGETKYSSDATLCITFDDYKYSIY